MATALSGHVYTGFFHAHAEPWHGTHCLTAQQAIIGSIRHQDFPNFTCLALAEPVAPEL